MSKRRNYITCYINIDGELSPMGDAKTKEYAIEIAKRHKHVLCKLVKIKDYSK